MSKTVTTFALALTFFAGLALSQPVVPATTYTIAGTVGDTGTLCKTGVTLALSNGQTMMDSFTGTYSFPGLDAGTYTITPSKPGCVYTPPSITVTVTNANSLSNNFQGAVAPITLAPATLPSGAVNAAYSEQLSASGGTAPYNFTVISGNLPAGLALSLSGLLSGTPTQATTTNFTVQAQDARLAIGQITYALTVTPGATLTLGPATLPQAFVSAAYSAQLTASGGTAPYTFKLASGSLPTGLTLSSSGLLAGTPSQQQNAVSFSVQASDANGVTGQIAYTLSVVLGTTLTLGPASLPSATVGAAYSEQLTASGGTGPYTFTFSGSLPAGLTLSSSGLISGTPTQQAAANFTVTAKDANGVIGQLACTLSVAPGVTFTFGPSTLPAAIVGVAYSAQLSVSGGTAPYTFSVLSGNLPAGFNLSASGLISGTSAQQTTASFTVQAKDANSFTGQMAYTLTVGANNCTYNLSPPSGNLQTSGGGIGFSVSTQAGCPSGLLIDDSTWIHLSSSSTLSGGGSVSLSVDPNNGPAGRSSVVGVTNASGDVVGSFAITQAGVAASITGLTFVPLAPCRVLETRVGQASPAQVGAFGPPSFTAGQTRTLVLPQSAACNIPAAKAYVVNVTSIPAAPGRTNALTIYPADEEQPRYTTAGTPDGNTRANGAIIRARATDGAINVYSTDATDVLIDVAGYFTDSAATPLVFYPLTPCRVVETRAAARGPGPFGGPSMAAGETRQYAFPKSPDCVIPSGAAAYSTTITVVPQGTLFYLTAWPGPAGVPQPVVSSLNAFDGAIVPNSAIIPAGSDGSIQIYTSNPTDFFIDINGYFAPDNGTGLSYYPVTQCTAANSADPMYSGVYGGPQYPGGARSIAVPASPFCAAIPSTAKGYAVDITANPHGNTLAYVTLYPTGSPVPTASMLNDFQKQVVTNSAIVPAGANGSIDVLTNGGPTDIQLMISGYFSR